LAPKEKEMVASHKPHYGKKEPKELPLGDEKATKVEVIGGEGRSCKF